MMTMTMTTAISGGLQAPAGCVRCVFSQTLHSGLPETAFPLSCIQKVASPAEA